jgi:hypothetical protein
MRLFSTVQPAREAAVESMDRAATAKRRALRAVDNIAGRVANRTAALGHRGADAFESAAGAVRARPVAAVAMFAALTAAAAAVAGYLAYHGRR